MGKINQARDALTEAETQVAKAERARDDAFAILERELAAVGWTRLQGAFNPGAVPLYKSLVFPNAALDVEQVLTHLGQQRAAAVA